jgi:hypothetical protein
MPVEQPPEPLRTVLVTVFHANVYSAADWRQDLLRWETSRPEYAALIKQQFADVVYRDTLTFSQFVALTGQEVLDENEMKQWFRQRFYQHWGRQPKESDCTP